MKSYSAHKQDNIWFKKKLDNHYLIRLRKNHEEVERETDDGVEKMWVCDEIEFQTPLRKDIKEYVEQNFDKLYDKYEIS